MKIHDILSVAGLITLIATLTTVTYKALREGKSDK